MANIARPPCYGCTERSATCHAECEKYLAYRKQVDAQRDARIKDSLAWSVFKQRKTYNIKFKQRLNGHNAVWRGK